MGVVGNINVNNFGGGSYTGTGMTPNNLSTPPGTTPAQFYDRLLLKTLRQTTFIHDRFAQVRSIARNAGTKTINFRKMGKLSPTSTPLVEGVTPTGDTASKTNITATVDQYGKWMAFSDKVNFEEIDPIISGYVMEQGHQAAESKDNWVREILTAGTNVVYASTATTRVTVATGMKFTLADARKVVRDFRKNNVKPVYNGNYACFISPHTEFDLMNDPDFQKFMQFGMTNKPMLDNEIGTIFNITFFRTNNAKVFTGAGAAAIDVHASMFIGADAYGVVNVEGEGSVESIVKGVGSAGTEDPLNQRQSVGWKLNAFGAVRLEELAIYRYEHAVS